MNRTKRLRLAALPAAAALTAVVVLPGCGNDVPSNAVAKVEDSVITKAEFNHWLTAAAGSQAPPEGGKIVVPDPPNFTKCAAAKAKQPVPEGASKPTAKQSKDQCKQEYDGLKDQVMQFLISSEWIQKEAESQDVEATNAEVRKAFEEQKKQSFPDDKDYKAFLKSSGQTEQDLLFRVKLDVLTNEIRKKVTEDAGKIGGDDVKEYYEKNKAQFGQPERRDLLVVLTENEGEAEKAKQALDDDQAFKDVAKKFSIDDASKQQGGKLPGVSKGQQEKALDDAVFKADRGKVVGPVKTQFGYYVFEVEKITPGKQQSLKQSEESIKNLLKSEREQKALDEFVEDFRKKFKDETKCAKGYIVEDCENAPKEKDTNPASGGAPQGPGGAPGGSPQGVPPGAAPQGVPPGAAPQGVPPGAAPQGVPPGAAPQGVPPGAAPQGVPPGAAPQGVPPGGGAPPQGGAPPPAP